MAKRLTAAKATSSVEVVERSLRRTTSNRPPVSLVRAECLRLDGEGGRAAASVFMSYSRHDQVVCDQIARELKERGHEVWVDGEAIHGGDAWRAEIEKGIKKCDVFVILLSPNVVRNPEYTGEELGFARKHCKKIVAVKLKAQLELPDGWGLTLSGRQHIEMTDFDRGIRRLFEALGEPAAVEPAQPTSLWDRTLRKVQRARAVVANSDFGPAALKLGAAALAGAAAVAVAVATISEEKRKGALRVYRASVEKILGDCWLQLKLTEDMTPEEYAREFRPRFRRLLGQLEATPAPTDDLRGHHAELVANLERAVNDFDDAVAKIERGDGSSARRAVTRSAAAFSETLKSYTSWLDGLK